VLVRGLGLIAVVAIPVLAVYALIPGFVLRLAFGAETERAAHALPLLGLAMALLAAGYLGVQFMLALRRTSFLFALGLAAAAEVVLLAAMGLGSLVDFAAVVLALQAVAAGTILALGLSGTRRPVTS
jgi:O-antigen/teichoic acid export membrane protein